MQYTSRVKTTPEQRKANEKKMIACLIGAAVLFIALCMAANYAWDKYTMRDADKWTGEMLWQDANRYYYTHPDQF